MFLGFPHSSVGKESACSAGDQDSIPGLGRYPGAGNSNPLQFSCLENPMDGGAWQATVHGVAKSWTRISDFHFHYYIDNVQGFLLYLVERIEKIMSTSSSQK